MIGTPALVNRSIARVASISARSCGVDTITAPAGLCFWIMVSCTSPVPGGMSTTSVSTISQWASTNWVSAPAAIGPRHAIAWPPGTSCPIDKSGTPTPVATGTSFLSCASALIPSTPSRRGCDGP